jgi:hypothetical protein
VGVLLLLLLASAAVMSAAIRSQLGWCAIRLVGDRSIVSSRLASSVSCDVM